MAQTDFHTALQGANAIEITVTGRTSGRSLSYPVWFALDGGKLYLRQREDVHRERSFSHRRGAARQSP
jgi:hypothetical protein